jgi:hypothetical protein
MKKAIFFLMIVLIVMSSCKKDDTTQGNGTSLDNKENAEDSGTTDNGFSDEPTKNNDLVQFCLSAQMPRYMTMCTAIASKDPEICKQIVEEKDAEQRYQRARCITLTAMASKDSSICDKYETVVSEGGSSIDTGCRMAAATGTLKISECEKLTDENARNGCIYDVNFMTGKTKVSECIDSDCVFNYAWINKDKKACDMMTEVSTASPMSASFKVACYAMLSGNEKECDPIKGVGVDEWYFCITKALYKQVMPSPGIYNLDICEDNTLCFKFALRDMATYLAKNKN